MIKLSDRLQTIANRINRGETMADIGTDHGFLPIYLIQNNISPRVIMADVSEPSLMKAKHNFDAEGDIDGEKVDFRVGDGLSVLANAEVDTIVIAGMGGKLIRDIMAADMSLTCSFKKFILQPRIGQGHLIRWLIENNFLIISEDLVREGKFIPEIITAVTPGMERFCQDKAELGIPGFNLEDTTGDDMIFKIPPWIISANGPVEDFLIRNIDKEENKLQNVMSSKNRNQQFERKISDEIDYLKDLLEEYRNER